MKAENYEYYVSPELAKLLKEAGFDWGCRGYYDRKVLRFNFVWDHNGKGASTQCSAPTLEVAQRWLREVKGYIVEVLWYKKEFDYQGMVIEDEHYKWFSSYPLTFQIEGKDVYDILHDKDGNHYSTYESALEAGIKKALEIILEK